MQNKLIAKQLQITEAANKQLDLHFRSASGDVSSITLGKAEFETLTFAIFQTLLTVPQSHPFFELRQLLSVSNLTVQCQVPHVLTTSLTLGADVEIVSTLEYQQVLDLKKQIDLALSQYAPPNKH